LNEQQEKMNISKPAMTNERKWCDKLDSKKYGRLADVDTGFKLNIITPTTSLLG